jgi:hypothetical protein
MLFDLSAYFRSSWQIRKIDLDIDMAGFVQSAQPGELALGQLAGGEDAAIRHFCCRQATFQHLPDLAVANTAHRRQFAVESSPDDLRRAGFSEHAIAALDAATREAAERRAAWEAEHTLRTRSPLINLRIVAEMMLFIGQTGMNLSQAMNLSNKRSD